MKIKFMWIALLILCGASSMYGAELEYVESSLSLKGGSASEKVAYYANHELEEEGSIFTRAIIVVHGSDRNALDYYQTIANIAQSEGEESTLIIAPHFKVTSDSADANELQWLSPGGWKSGSKSSTKDGLSRISSFAVMDEFIEKLLNKDQFANLNEIVLTGHSAGGQFTHRYAATTQLNVEGTTLRYVVANPATYLYFDEKRPALEGFEEPSSSVQAECSTYNDYKYGMNNPYSYLAALSAEEVKSQYLERTVVYLLGTEDTAITALSTSGCEAELQGKNRYERGKHYSNYVNTLSDNNAHTLLEVEGVGHTRTGMYSSENGIKALFKMGIEELAGNNYISNAGAEEGTTGWSTFGGGTDIQSSTTQAHAGTHSFLSENRTEFYHGPSTNIKPLVDSGTVVSGERYTVSVWVYHRESTAKKLHLNIKQVDSSGTNYNKLEDELVPPNQWVKIVKHFILDVDASLQSLDLYVVSSSGETFDFYTDDYFLGELENYTPPSSSSSNDFIKASGKNLVVGNEPIVLRGINVQVPVDGDNTAQDVWDVKSVSLKDFKNIKSLGFNSIRLHLNYKLFEDDSNIGVYKEDGWHWLDRAIAFAKEANLYVLLDMHGGQGGYQSDKSQGFSAFWDGVGTAPYTSNQQRLINLWGAIAERYQHETTILGYDLLNEPRPNDSEEWISYAEQIIAKIRTKDSQHLIILETPFIPGYHMRTVSDTNILYDSHTYAIWEYSIQYSVHYGKEGQRWGAYSNTNPLYVDGSWNVAWEPSEGGTPPANTRPFNKEFLEQVLVDDILEFAHNNNVPVNVGEFGSGIETFYNNVGAIELTKDTYAMFAGNNRYGMKVSNFYFTYHNTTFGLYQNWQGFQVDEANVNKELKAVFKGSTDDNNNDTNSTDGGDDSNTTDGGDDGDDGEDDVDTTVPVITLIGDALINLKVNDTYNDAGATAVDNVDGDITAQIVSRGEVNTQVEGSYQIYYNVSDSSDNTAVERVRTVTVEAQNDDNDNDNGNNEDDEPSDETDLKLEFSWGNYPKVPVIGRAHKFVTRVYNISDVVATETKLNIDLPDGASLHKGRGCTLNDDEVSITCNIGKIPANQRRTRTIYLRFDEGGDIAVDAEVVSATDDSEEDNNEATARVSVSEDADLSVTIRKKGKARVGRALGIKIRTKNKGPAFAKEVTTVFAIPENADFISTSSDACTYIADWDEVYCEWGTLSKRATRTVYVYIRPTEKGTVEIEAEVEDADENDPNSDNNHATKSFRVR